MHSAFHNPTAVHTVSIHCLGGLGISLSLSLALSHSLCLLFSVLFALFGSVAFCPFSGWISFIHIPPSLAHMQLFGLSHHYQDFTATCSFQCLTLAYQKCHLCNLNNINCLHLQSYLHKYCRKKVTILVVVKQKQMETASGEPMAGSFILNLWKTSGLCSQWLTWWDRSWPSPSDRHDFQNDEQMGNDCKPWTCTKQIVYNQAVQFLFGRWMK